MSLSRTWNRIGSALNWFQMTAAGKGHDHLRDLSRSAPWSHELCPWRHT